MQRIIIIGGGIGGLSCLNALLDQGIPALLIESGTIGSPKICGEFIAPFALQQLQEWDIGPITPIHSVSFFAKSKKYTLNFPHAAGAMARAEAELQLKRRAIQKGGEILENTLITSITPATTTAPYFFKLNEGKEISAEISFFATGKINNIYHHKMDWRYYGIKFHWPGVLQPETLLMYSDRLAYGGLVPINQQMSNFACLIEKKLFDTFSSSRDFLSFFLNKNKELKSINLEGIQLLDGKSPDFTIKKPPLWPNAFWIGDALSSFYPAVGCGFAHSVSSALLAVACYLQNNAKSYAKRAHISVKSKYKLGKLMHHLLLNPQWSSPIFSILNQQTSLTQFFLRKLDYDR